MDAGNCKGILFFIHNKSICFQPVVSQFLYHCIVDIIWTDLISQYSEFTWNREELQFRIDEIKIEELKVRWCKPVTSISCFNFLGSQSSVAIDDEESVEYASKHIHTSMHVFMHQVHFFSDLISFLLYNEQQTLSSTT